MRQLSAYRLVRLPWKVRKDGTTRRYVGFRAVARPEGMSRMTEIRSSETSGSQTSGAEVRSIEDLRHHYAHRAAELPERIVLRDGTMALVGPLERKDRADLAREYETLSFESKWHRFLGAVQHLNPELLDLLVDDVDGVDHVALMAFVEVDGEPVPAALGRIVRHRQLPDAADIAVTVKDEFQGRGIASALMALLIGRLPPGVTHLLTEVAPDNAPSLAMLRRVGPTQMHLTDGVFDVEVDLSGEGFRYPEPPAGERLHPALATTSGGELRRRDQSADL